MSVTDFSSLRRLMVERQLIPRGIHDARVLGAMARVPRHEFVAPELRGRAYDDMALGLSEGQTISQPYIVAAMTEALALAGPERVLEIGTGSGYQAAVLCELAAHVYSVERHAELSARACRTLSALGYGNFTCLVGDGTLGWPDHAPYDRIIVTAAAPSIPGPLVEQLSEGGIIVVPVGGRYSQMLVRGVRRGGALVESEGTPCVFVPLIGRYGWEGPT